MEFPQAIGGRPVTATRWLQGEGEAHAQLFEVLEPHTIMRIFVPSRDRDGRPLPSRALRHRVEETLAPLMGGTTSFPGIGTWLLENGVIMRERVTVVESMLLAQLTPSEKLRVAELLGWLLESANQEAVAVSVLPLAQAHFVRASLATP